MLYSDGIHLISDISVEDLHKEALKLGIKRCWYHRGKSQKFPHYDIPKMKRTTFFNDHPQVKQVSPRDIVKICQIIYSK